tara:strand:+ start:2578 stop:3009 length:432 start_codon:yes stop_codon:yes gene_type:complete
VFKNGKRAKAPMMSFRHNGGKEEVTIYFNTNIKKNFNEKNRELKFMLVRADASQERREEQKNQQDAESLKKQTLILGRFLKGLDIKTKHKVVGGLIFASATHWKWQWCALECGTNNYIAGLSPRFDNPTEADKWMKQQIHNLN